MSNKYDYTDAKGQMRMLRSAQERTFAVCRTFNEMMQSGNPLTPQEVSKLVRKRPEMYGVLDAFAAD